MRITKRRLRQIIKEELEAALKENQGQLDEGMGMVAMLMMKLFPPGVDTLEANNVELDKNQVQAVLQIVHQQAPSALGTMADDLDSGFAKVEDANGNGVNEIPKPRVMNPNTYNDIINSIAGADANSPAAKTIEKMADNPSFAKRVVDKIQNSDNPAGQAKQLQDAPGFDGLDQTIQDKINSIATSSN